MTYITTFDERPNIDCEDLHARAAVDGYIPFAHVEQDKDHTLGKHKDKTKHQQVIDLEKYIAWHQYVMKWQGSPVTRDVAREQMLCKGAELPSFGQFMDFVRYFIAASKGGKIDVAENPKKSTPLDSKDKKNKIKKKLTVDSVNSSLERIFAGWERHTKGEVSKEFRSRAYNHVRDVLCRVQNLLVDVKKPKHNFGPTDLDRLQKANVERVDDVPGLYIIQFLAVMGLYFVTGARIGAFFDEGGLRWKDLCFVLQRVPEGGWRAFYQVKQRYVKNNRSPEHNYFGVAGRQHSRLLYNETAMLLVLAIFQQVLVGIDTLQDLFEQEIDAKEKRRDLLVEDWATENFVLRKVDPVTGKMTDDPMPKGAFLDIFRRTFLMSGSVASPSIHAIRRGLGKYVGERYTQVQLAQLLTQADTRVFGQSYVANCSDVDSISAFLGEERQTEHIEYFQGLELFHEEGLPTDLSAARKAAVLASPILQHLRAEIEAHEQAAGGDDAEQLKKLRAHYQTTRRRLLREELKPYQTQWIRERREWKIRTKGKVKSELPDKGEAFHYLSLVLPERGRIASLMSYKDPVEGPLLKQVMQDLLLVAGDDHPVLYLPNLKPRDGRWCPAASCGQDLNRVNKNRRSLHIQACRRQELAAEHTLLTEEVHYCYLCYDWVCGSTEWEQHCSEHLADWRWKACGTLTHRHTVYRLAYCKDCLSNKTLPASERLKGWPRNDNKQRHVADKGHRDSIRFPAPCTHMECEKAANPEIFETRDALENHDTDVHGEPRSTLPGCRPKKRESSEDTTDRLVWQPLDSPARKKARLSAIKAEPAGVPIRPAATVEMPAVVAVEVDVARQVLETMSSPRRVSEFAIQREMTRFAEPHELTTSPVAPTIDLRGPEEVELRSKRHVPVEPPRLATHLKLRTSSQPDMKRSESPDELIDEIVKPSSTHGQEACTSLVESLAATEPIHRAYEAPRSGRDPPFRPRRTCAQNKAPFSRRVHGSGGSARSSKSKRN